MTVFSSAARRVWANGLSHRKNVSMLLPEHASEHGSKSKCIKKRYGYPA
jgi:hypothetical protein